MNSTGSATSQSFTLPWACSLPLRKENAKNPILMTDIKD